MQNTRMFTTTKYIQKLDRINISVPFYSASNVSTAFELFAERSFFLKTAKKL